VPTVNGEPPGPSVAGDIYLEAERALAGGRPAAAARILEDLIERLPETPEAQSARLELGRLYAGPLGQPAHAVVHLSAFVEIERDPSARGAAKGLLCSLVPAAERDRICWRSLALGGDAPTVPGPGGSADPASD
jgi:hypothetical protein